MNIACGHCKSQHSSITEVRACSTAHYEGKAQRTAAAAALTATTPRVPASPAQMRFITSLNAERTVPVAGQTDDEAFLVERNFDALGSGKFLSVTEASRVINWLKALPFDLSANVPTVSTTAPVQPATRQPYPQVPEGYYAVRSATGNNDLDFFRVDRPTEGQWKGRTFVKRVVGGKPDFPVRGDSARKALEAILLATPREASALYGQEIGRCGRCNRHLTDEISRGRGFGSDCWSKI